MTALSADELARYARHIVLPEIGGAGQLRLKRAHVVVIGAGGIGSPVLQYLAAAGIGQLTVIDDDRVDEILVKSRVTETRIVASILSTEGMI